jgi:hypothetical protein
MSNSNRLAISLVSIFASLASFTACSKEPEKGAAPAPSASAAPSAMAAAPASASATPAPSASAAEPVVPHDCPKGSTGQGSASKPCEAKGGARLMEVAWTGKTDDKGPQFRVTNKSAITILHGKVAVYFYDKAGKQLDVQDTAATPPKAVPYRTCSGKIFGGVMKPAEKAVITFSCVTKANIPEGTAAIEAEMPMVGFADAADEKKVDFYWRNNDLTPDARKKGGIK